MPRKKTIAQILYFPVWFILGSSLLISCDDKSQESQLPDITSTFTQNQPLPTEILTLAGQKFTVELAFTRPSRSRGLMFRKNMPPNSGMLFVFASSAPRNFYMKNCLIDLDALFIKADGAIANIQTMKVPQPAKPLKYYYSKSPVKYVLELPAGAAKKLGLKPDQKIELPPRVTRIIPEPD